MQGLLSDQVAIITGAGRGIGEATAHLFARHGAQLLLTDLDRPQVERVASIVRETGCDAIALGGDVCDPTFPDLLMAACIEKFGKLNILVNNAGYTWDGMLHKMTDKQWQAMLDVHNTAPFRLIRAAAPHMRDAARAERAEGVEVEPRCIVNVSSTSGLHGNAGQANYSTAKMGVLGLTKTVAKEWGPFGIRCNAVAFGFIETRLTQEKEAGEKILMDGEEIPLGIPGHLKSMAEMIIPMARTGTVDEAAGGILLMASPLAAYVTGHTLEVTGGMGI